MTILENIRQRLLEHPELSFEINGNTIKVAPPSPDGFSIMLNCWTVQQNTPEGWEDDSTTGLLFFPFWRRRAVVYRRNHVIKSARYSK